MLPRLESGLVALGTTFHQPTDPTPLPDPALLAWNPAVADSLGLTDEPQSYRDWLAGNRLAPGSRPTAAAYAGHQFGSWVATLGDGRALILGELIGSHHRRRELMLKGSGPTRWSRGGDGRAVLRSTIREYLASAAMAGLGIPTTEALAIVGSSLPVFRERTETAAVLTRVAPSHLRFGSFEYLAARRRDAERRQLVDWTIERCFPELLVLPADQRYGAWYHEVVSRTAELMAAWTAVGFAHGVMNSDNFSILGLTLDYGPFGWLERYDPAHVCNHSDTAGRYAFDQQPAVGLWNCARLGEALYPLVGDEPARAALAEYPAQYQQAVLHRYRAKLGLTTARNDDAELITDLLTVMHQQGADYSNTFRALSIWSTDRADGAGAPAAFRQWFERYSRRLADEATPPAARRAAMDRVNPRYILRNWIAEEVIGSAEAGRAEAVDSIRAVLDRPFDEHPGMERLTQPGTVPIVVSCSA